MLMEELEVNVNERILLIADNLKQSKRYER